MNEKDDHFAIKKHENWMTIWICYFLNYSILTITDGGNLSDYSLVSSNLSYTFSERSQNNQSSENNQMKNKNYI